MRLSLPQSASPTAPSSEGAKRCTRFSCGTMRKVMEIGAADRKFCRGAAPLIGELAAVRPAEGSPDLGYYHYGKETVMFRPFFLFSHVHFPALSLPQSLRRQLPRQREPRDSAKPSLYIQKIIAPNGAIIFYPIRLCRSCRGNDAAHRAAYRQ